MLSNYNNNHVSILVVKCPYYSLYNVSVLFNRAWLIVNYNNDKTCLGYSKRSLLFKLTLSTIKSIDSAILLSTLSEVKLPISILFNTSEGSSQNRAAESWYSNTDVSVKVLQRIRDATRGQLLVNSANFWAMKPPERLHIILTHIEEKKIYDQLEPRLI